MPSEREGFSSPSRSYRRSVCGCSSNCSATALIVNVLARLFISDCQLPIGSPSRVSGHRLKNRRLEIGNRQCHIPAPPPPVDCPHEFTPSDETPVSSIRK